jgi:lipopolysaccharide export system permease protein
MEACVVLNLLHRTILWELVKVFLMSLSGITAILLMAGIVTEATQHGLGPGQILSVIPLLIPSTLPYTIPATTLFATCVVYGRLANDNEIIAIKSAGINMITVVWPGFLLGLTMSLTTLVLYIEVIPHTHHYMRGLFMNDIEEMLYMMLKRDRMIKQPKLNYVMFVKEVQGRVLQDALFKRRDPKGKNYDIVARAREAELRVDIARNEVRVLMRHCYVLSGSDDKGLGYFESREWPVELPPDFGKNQKIRAGDLSWDELTDRKEEILAEEDKLSAQIALHTSRDLITNAADSLPMHVKHLQSIRRSKELEWFSLNTEMQMRPALAMGCLFFVLVGCPVGIWLSRSDYLSAFTTCFLPIVFVYYPLLLCATNFAKGGQVDALVAMWVPNAVMAGLGSLMFRQLLRH